jgi:hypothetical protein
MNAGWRAMTSLAAKTAFRLEKSAMATNRKSGSTPKQHRAMALKAHYF